MNTITVKITPLYGGVFSDMAVNAKVIKEDKKRVIERRYISDSKFKEMLKDGFAFLEIEPGKLI